MNFSKAISPWSADKIAEILGCPVRTIYAWKMGERLPPEWVQKLVIERMKRLKATSTK